MSYKPFLILTTCSLIALGACSPLNGEQGGQNDGTRAETTEDILAAQGSWSMVDEDAPQSPMAMHSSARKQVNPSNLAPRHFIPPEQMANVEGTQGNEDVHFRLIRMEREVEDLRQDFDKLLPPLSNLIVADRDLDRTIEEIQARPERKPVMPQQASSKPMADVLQRTARAPMAIHTQEEPAGAIAPPVPAVQSEPAKAAPAPGGQAVVNSVRLGDHPGKTRLVLDMTGASKYKVDVDNNEKLLLIELSDAGWSAAQQKVLNNPLVKGYTTQAGPNGGTMLALELKKPVKVLGSSALKPNGQTGHRIYFDLAPSS